MTCCLSLALPPPVITRSGHPHASQDLAHRSSLTPMRSPTPSPLFLNRHQPPPLLQSKFISFFNSLITSAWFSTTSLSFRFSASNRLRSTGFNGRLFLNDARTPTSNCRFHLRYSESDSRCFANPSLIVLLRSMSFKISNFCSGVNFRRTFFPSLRFSSMSFPSSLERLTSLPHFCLISKKTGQVNRPV